MIDLRFILFFDVILLPMDIDNMYNKKSSIL